MLQFGETAVHNVRIEFWHGTGTPRDEDWGVEPEAAWGQLGTPGNVRGIATKPGAYQDIYGDIRDALRKGTPPPVTIDQAIDVLALIEAARRSADEGVTVQMGQVAR